MANNCKICYNPLGMYKHNRQSYCSDSCRKIGKDAHNRVNAQNRVYVNIITGRKCTRCLKIVHEKGMRKVCTSCKEETAKKPCIDCGKLHARRNAKLCMACAMKRRKPKKVVKKEVVKKVVVKKGKAIDPKWLSRGDISNHGKGSSLEGSGV